MSGVVQGLRFVCLAIGLCCGSSFAAAKNMPRYGLFVYSNFCISPMSGDLAGDRITLHRFVDGDTLIYEYTDGSTHAVVARKVGLDAKPVFLQFEVHGEGDLNALVSGKFSPDGSILTVSGLLFHESETFVLKRVMDFAAPLVDCKALNNGERIGDAAGAGQ
jgi:hypothetical protein